MKTSGPRAKALNAVPTPPETVHQIVQVFASALIAVTLVESLMVGINRSPLSPQTKLLYIRFGEWLFVPALAMIGLTVRALAGLRFLAVTSAVVTSYVMLTQFRGAWIWSGTFDDFRGPRAFVIPLVIGALLAVVMSHGPRSKRATSRVTWFLLFALALCLILAAWLPRYWPSDSEFAPMRWIALAVALLILIVTTIAVGDTD